MSKETIVILNKGPRNLSPLKPMLEKERYIVLGVNTVERTLKSFKEFEVSGLITDYKVDHDYLPEIIKKIKKSFPELYVMMIGDESIDEREYAKVMEAGVNDFITQPVPYEKKFFLLKRGLRLRQLHLHKRLEKE
jgi:DNA-binding NtrC family response regulator